MSLICQPTSEDIKLYFTTSSSHSSHGSIVLRNPVRDLVYTVHSRLSYSDALPVRGRQALPAMQDVCGKTVTPRNFSAGFRKTALNSGDCDPISAKIASGDLVPEQPRQPRSRGFKRCSANKIILRSLALRHCLVHTPHSLSA